MTKDLRRIYLDDVLARFRGLHALAESAIAQLDDEELFQASAAGGNSVAVLIKHISGNMISRWSDFLTTDGESPDRDRDAEFEIFDGDDAQSLRAIWDRAWSTLLTTIESLDSVDLDRNIRIRDEPHSVIEAINRQIAHYGMHVGQIILLAKQIRGSNWKSLSIPKGQSKAFNAKMREQGSTAFRRGMPSDRT